MPSEVQSIITNGFLKSTPTAFCNHIKHYKRLSAESHDFAPLILNQNSASTILIIFILLCCLFTSPAYSSIFVLNDSKRQLTSELQYSRSLLGLTESLRTPMIRQFIPGTKKSSAAFRILFSMSSLQRCISSSYAQGFAPFHPTFQNFIQFFALRYSNLLVHSAVLREISGTLIIILFAFFLTLSSTIIFHCSQQSLNGNIFWKQQSSSTTDSRIRALALVWLPDSHFLDCMQEQSPNILRFDVVDLICPNHDCAPPCRHRWTVLSLLYRIQLWEKNFSHIRQDRNNKYYS